MNKIIAITVLAAVLLAGMAFAQMDSVTGDFKRSGMMMQDPYMEWAMQQHYEGKRQMHTGFGLLMGLALVGFILAEWLFVIKLYREVFKKR